MVLSVVFVNVETPRFREPVDPFLVLLAACAMGSVLERAERHQATVAHPRPGRADPTPWRTERVTAARP